MLGVEKQGESIPSFGQGCNRAKATVAYLSMSKEWSQNPKPSRGHITLRNSNTKNVVFRNRQTFRYKSLGGGQRILAFLYTIHNNEHTEEERVECSRT